MSGFMIVYHTQDVHLIYNLLFRYAINNIQAINMTVL